MTRRLLLDTDVLIDYLRARKEAVTYMTSLTDSLSMSVITVAELYAGVRDGAERVALEVFLRAFLILPISHKIAVKGGLYRRDYGKSHSVGLPDALIAATVEHHQATLVTLNNKHFPMLTNLVVPYQKP
ncbi:MAG TPA: type II toxin-antitoxin system VapC family toxin [Herpetosiphonaceae bacterium]